MWVRLPLSSAITLKPTHLPRHLLFAAALLAGSTPGAWGASAPQKGYESSGSPRPEFLLETLRAQIGRKYWVRRPLPGQSPKALFCNSNEAPPFRENPLACPGEKYGVEKSESFSITDVAIAKPNPAHSWLKIQFESGKTAYLSPQDFTEHRYREDRISVSLYSIDEVLGNSGWIFDEYPESVLNRRRAQLEYDEPGRAQERLEKERVVRGSILQIGMTTQQVLNSAWGKPDSITLVTDGSRTLEQWNYGVGNTLYFDRGRLHRFQASR
jgi:hypothetical protein